MKRFLLTCLVSLLVASPLLAGDHIELGTLTTKNGVRVLVLYSFFNDAYTEADLIFPDGKEIHVPVKVEISAEVLDKALQQIADQQP